MRKMILAGSLFLVYITSSAQHTEFTAGLNGNSISFRGHSVVNSSFVIVSDFAPGGNYTNYLYSKKAGIGIGADFALQRVTKKRFVYGIATGIELLKHNVPITSVSTISGGESATGTIHMHTHFINLRPMAGYRFRLNKNISLDLAASLDIAFGLGYLYEVGIVTTSTDVIVRVENDRDKLRTDLRPGLQARLNIKRFSILTGYWLGQSDYYKGYLGGNPEAYSKLFRLGLSYRLIRSK